MAAILITGATGFMGRRLLARLTGQHQVWAISRRRRPVDPGDPTRWLWHDLASPLPPVGLPPRIDAVIHLAQSPRYRDFPDGANDIFAVSTGACAHLLEWARRAGARRFILASTGGLYGSSAAPAREEDPLAVQNGPLSFYFAAKRSAELLALAHADLFNTLILRFFFVYGPGQNPSMLIPRLFQRIAEGAPVVLRGADGLLFNPIHVDDAVTAIERGLNLDGGGVVNIAGPEVTSLGRAARAIGALVGRPPQIIHDSDAGDDLVADITRMTAALGAPRIGVDAGLASLSGAALSGAGFSGAGFSGEGAS